MVWCLLLSVSYSVADDNSLVFYNWSDYIPDEVLKQFTKETGIQLQTPNYDDNEAMYAKIKTVKGKGYDVIVPSTYYVDRMSREGLLHEIDHSKLKNFSNLNPKLLNQSFDKGNKYSVPYLWGTTSMSINTSEVTGKVDSWKELWKPDYKNRVLLLGDIRDVLGMALKVSGFSVNATKESEIKAAYELLVKLLPNVLAFNDASPITFYLNDEVSLGMNTSDMAYRAYVQNPQIQYIYPKEGAILWMDNLCIVKNTEHYENALKFIDFILRPDIAKTINEKIGASTPNLAALKLLPEKVRNNPIVNPSDDDLKNAEYEVDIGDAILIYQKYWQQLKAGG